MWFATPSVSTSLSTANVPNLNPRNKTITESPATGKLVETQGVSLSQAFLQRCASASIADTIPVDIKKALTTTPL